MPPVGYGFSPLYISLIRLGSPYGSSDHDQDEEERMEDLDEGSPEAEDEYEPDREGLAEDNEYERNEDNEDEEDQEGSPGGSNDRPMNTQASISTASLNGALPMAPTSHPRPDVYTTPSPRGNSLTTALNIPQVRPEALTAPVYDIVPTIAAPHSTSINAITATPDLRWVFSGGADGYIRKFNWVETANGKVMLTVAQRHPFVDTVTKAGVLTSYWENEEPQGR